MSRSDSLRSTGIQRFEELESNSNTHDRSNIRRRREHSSLCSNGIIISQPHPHPHPQLLVDVQENSLVFGAMRTGMIVRKKIRVALGHLASIVVQPMMRNSTWERLRRLKSIVSL